MDSDYAPPQTFNLVTLTGGTAANPTNIAPFVRSNTELLLGKGNYTLDETALGPVVSNFKIHGQHSGAGVSSGGTVLTISKAVSVADSTDFIDTEWWNLTVTSPDTTTNDAMFKGFGNLRNSIHDCLFIDFGPSIVQTHGTGFRFQRNLILTSSSPPAVVNSNIVAPLSMLITDNDWEFNAQTQNGLGRGIIVGGAGATMSGGSFLDWVVERNKFGISNQPNYAIDTFFDCEADQAAVPPTVLVRNNLVYNAKIAFSAAPIITISGNVSRITSNALAQANAGCGILQFSTGTSGHSLDCLTISDNVIVQDSVASVTWDWRAIALTPPNTTAAGPMRIWRVLRNTVIVNGRAAVPPNTSGPVVCNVPNGGAATTIDYLEIVDNVIGSTTVPASSPSAAIVVGDLSSIGTYNRVVVRGNRLMGTTAAGTTLPATTAGAFTYLLQVGIASKTWTCNTLEVRDNTCAEAALSSVTAAAPFLVSKAGTVAVSNFKYSGNTPRLSNLLTGQTTAIASVVSLSIPTGFPNLQVRVGGHVNVTTGTTDTIALSAVITPETSGAAQTYPLPLSTPTTGALIFTTPANTAGNFPAASLTATAKAGTTVTLQTSGTFTSVAYDVDGEIEVLP